jgi:hypothetical protein
MSSAAGPGTLSADKLCELTGLTDRQHRNIAKGGYFPAPLRGQYQATKTLQGLFRYFQELNRKKGESTKEAEHRLKLAKAEMAEEELAVFRGQYVSKAEVGPALRNVSNHQRAVLVRKLENELAPNLQGKTTLEIIERVKAAVDDICRVFREGTRQWLEVQSPGPTVQSLKSAPEAPAAAAGGAGKARKRPGKTGKGKKAKEDPHVAKFRKKGARGQ